MVFYIMRAPLNGVLMVRAPLNGVLYNGRTIKWCALKMPWVAALAMISWKRWFWFWMFFCRSSISFSCFRILACASRSCRPCSVSET